MMDVFPIDPVGHVDISGFYPGHKVLGFVKSATSLTRCKAARPATESYAIPTPLPGSRFCKGSYIKFNLERVLFSGTVESGCSILCNCLIPAPTHTLGGGGLYVILLLCCAASFRDSF